ncbi:Gastric triacylglycerol lipase [Trichinella nativa]|uniref:Lipase n=1 Tax=Trichinella nativa TaxID=6335 RepID=A0A0V1LB10_9BILA|nr:Gastric triacylglycerol lipase [Trichinella nativa]
MKFCPSCVLCHEVGDSSGNSRKLFFTAVEDCGRRHLPEVDLQAKEIIEYHGYTAEEHDVTTVDGYIIRLHRIPVSIENAGNTAVLLLHGLAASSTSFITNEPKQCLAFLLADRGYDVWLGNVRGNLFCQQHRSLTSEDPKFWRFSWDEMAAYDFPATVDYILEKTEKETLRFVGYSQGALIGFAALSLLPDLRQKICCFVALAPAVTLAYFKSPLRHVNRCVPLMERLFRRCGESQHGDATKVSKYMKPFLKNDPFDQLSQNIIFRMIGPDSRKYIDKDRIPVYLSHNPAGTSYQNMVHYLQMMNSKQLRHFDYGLVKNFLKYGQARPPIYPLENVDVPLYIIWSEKDVYANKKDIELLFSRVRHAKELKITDYSHLDFLWANNVGETVYSRVIEFLEQF